MRNAMHNKHIQKIMEFQSMLADDAAHRYGELFDNNLYIAAMAGDISEATAERGVKLQDQALALCGDTTCAVGNLERLTPAEARFLARFCTE